MFEKNLSAKLVIFILTLVMIIHGTGLSFNVKAATQTFLDVPPTEWYFQAVENGVTRKLIAPSEKYRPADHTRRSETAKLLTLFAQYPLNLSQGELDSIRFTDLPEDEWYTEYVKTLVSNKVINGYLDEAGNSTGFFGPADFVTRNQTAAMLNRIMKLEFDTPLDSPFKDINSSHWAYEDVMALYDAKIIEGYDDLTYRGDTLINRAEMAQILDRAQTWLSQEGNGVSEPFDSDEPTPPAEEPIEPNPTAPPVDPMGLENKEVTFQGKDGVILNARLYKPEGVGPFPAMVFMHGCTGLLTGGASTDYLASQYVWWGEKMAKEEKVVALFVDSFTPRNIQDGVCDNGNILNEVTERPKDAYAGLAYLRTQGYVQDKKIGLMGWSNGGSSVLSAMAKNYNPVSIPAGGGFITGVTEYPGCGLRNQFGTDYSTTGEGTYLPYAPVIVLGGEMDTTTPPTPKCVNLVNRAKELGASSDTRNDINLTIYSGATHSFDGAKVGTSSDADLAAQQAGRTLILNHLKEALK